MLGAGFGVSTFCCGAGDIVFGAVGVIGFGAGVAAGFGVEIDPGACTGLAVGFSVASGLDGLTLVLGSGFFAIGACFVGFRASTASFTGGFGAAESRCFGVVVTIRGFGAGPATAPGVVAARVRGTSAFNGADVPG